MGKPTVSSQDKVPLWKPLTVSNFLRLYLGESVSLLGDQFYIVALPWLTIQLTDSPVSLGTVLMAAAVPRAVLMLIGGVMSDRTAPRTIMLIANALRMVLTILLSALVMFRETQLWHLYVFALCFGIVDGFFIPAAKSIIPTLVTQDLLTASNTLSQGTTQLLMLIGPALGGLLIATIGIETAFAVDAVTFLFSAIMLFLIKTNDNIPIISHRQKNHLLTSIREGLHYTWHNPALRAVLLVITMLNLIFMGPLEVGMTALAQNRFSGSVIALGTMKSAWGAGGLLGTLIPAIVPRLPRIGILMLTLASIQGFGLLLLSWIPNVTLASFTIGLLGCCSGFFTLVGITWIQKQTPPDILGRVMSLGMLSSFGVAPISYALAGLLANVNLIILFSIAGGIMLIAIAWLSANPSVRAIE